MNAQRALPGVGRRIPACVLAIAGLAVVGFSILRDELRGSRGQLTVSPTTAKLIAREGGPAEEPVVFQLSNTGPEPLKLLGVRTSCDCMWHDPLPRDVLAPGEATELTAWYRFPSPGIHRPTKLTVITDAADHPETDLLVSLSGLPKSLPRVLRQPQHLELFAETPGGLAHGRFEISTEEPLGQPAMLEGFECADADVEVALGADSTATESGDSVYRVYPWTISARAPALAFETRRIVLAPRTTTGNHAKVDPVLVDVRCDPIIRCVPPKIVVRDAVRDDPIRIPAMLLGPVDSTWRIVEANADADWVRVEYEDDSENDGRALLQVIVAPEAVPESGAPQATVCIQTSSLEAPEVLIPVEYRPRRSGESPPAAP